MCENEEWTLNDRVDFVTRLKGKKEMGLSDIQDKEAVTMHCYQGEKIILH